MAAHSKTTETRAGLKFLGQPVLQSKTLSSLSLSQRVMEVGGWESRGMCMPLITGRGRWISFEFQALWGYIASPSQEYVVKLSKKKTQKNRNTLPTISTYVGPLLCGQFPSEKATGFYIRPTDVKS